MFPQVFVNTELENEIKSKGYVKTPYFSKDEVKQINLKFQQEFGSMHVSTKTFHTTNETGNDRLISEVNQFLAPYFLQKTNLMFRGLSPIGASFLIKEPKATSATPLHQDASFVDEPKHCSVSVWVALCDMDDKNGCLQFLPGSHLINSDPRFIPYTTISDTVMSKAHGLLTRNTIKAGEAFVFYNSIFHASAHNSFGARRIAAVMGFYSSGAQLSLYVKNDPDGLIHRYGVEPEELIGFHSGITFSESRLISKHSFPLVSAEKKLSDFIESELRKNSVRKHSLLRKGGLLSKFLGGQ